MNASDIICNVLNYSNLNPKNLSEKIGLDRPQAIYDIQKGKTKNISPNMADKIASAFPEINRTWLLTGEGEMLKGGAENTQQIGTPVYNIDVVCGREGCELSFTDERIIGYVDLPGISHASHIIEASGDSMSPRINNGDRIVVREIETWDYFVYGQAYVIITDEYRLLKYVRKHPDCPREFVILRSENPAYDDIELPITAIRKLFVVENVLSVKNVL